MKKECNHKRLKRNFPHGHNARPVRFCKDCGALVSNKNINDKIIERKRKRKDAR